MSMKPEFSRKVDVSHLAPEGRSEHLTATAEECEALAARFDVDAIHALTVDLSIQPWKKGACRVRGTAVVRMTRTCVISLDQFENTLEVKLDRLYASSPSYRADGKEIVVSLDDEDFGEIVDGEIEIGEMAVEELLLELDPHPRKPGASFTPEPANDSADVTEAGRSSPFAVLKSLRDSD